MKADLEDYSQSKKHKLFGGFSRGIFLFLRHFLPQMSQVTLLIVAPVVFTTSIGGCRAVPI